MLVSACLWPTFARACGRPSRAAQVSGGKRANESGVLNNPLFSSVGYDEDFPKNIFRLLGYVYLKIFSFSFI